MKMREHEFMIILSPDPTEEQADKLYGIFSDGTIATVAGTPLIHFHREADSLESAIRSAISEVRGAGFDVIRVELQPEMIPA
jgi:hypothetical protein